MNLEQIAIFLILSVTLILFALGRWRLDGIALSALLTCVLAGLVETGKAFEGFGHPAVITVIAVLMISRGLANSGLIGFLAEQLTRVAHGRFLQLTGLCFLALICSAFMNNVGALALLMPVAIVTARRFNYAPSQLLMPLAFASILGGLSTLIGTPPNIIIANYREQATDAAAFGLFDFTPVGLILALVGIVFIILVGRLLLPRNRQEQSDPEEIFKIRDYITEIRVTEESMLNEQTVRKFETKHDNEITVLGLIRNDLRVFGGIKSECIQVDDILLIQAAPDALEKLVGKTQVSLVSEEQLQQDLQTKETILLQAVVAPHSALCQRTPSGMNLRKRYAINLLAVSRQGEAIGQRLRNMRLQAGDVLLLQGEAETLAETAATLGCLPLASRKPSLQGQRQILLAVTLFGGAIGMVALGLLAPAPALLAAVLLMIVSGLLTASEAYQSIDWRVVVLLGAMIPVGGALETTGATQLMADGIGDLTGQMSLHLLLALLMVITMTLSDVINNAATSVIMAPVAVTLAHSLGVSPDPLLMAVAVGASSAFLTPIGHQNNTLVMGPGGYRFSDYWRLGLPLEILLVTVATPLIPWVWPFLPTS